MNRLATILVTCLLFSALSGIAGAVDAPVVLTHHLTSSSQGATTLGLDFTIHLENPGNSTLTNLDLTFIPFPPFTARGLVLRLDKVGPHQGADLALHLETRAQNGADQIQKMPLRFIGKYVAADGTPCEFPVTSYPQEVRNANQ